MGKANATRCLKSTTKCQNWKTYFSSVPPRVSLMRTALNLRQTLHSASQKTIIENEIMDELQRTIPPVTRLPLYRIQ